MFANDKHFSLFGLCITYKGAKKQVFSAAHNSNQDWTLFNYPWALERFARDKHPSLVGLFPIIEEDAKKLQCLSLARIANQV